MLNPRFTTALPCVSYTYSVMLRCPALFPALLKVSPSCHTVPRPYSTHPVICVVSFQVLRKKTAGRLQFLLRKLGINEVSRDFHKVPSCVLWRSQHSKVNVEHPQHTTASRETAALLSWWKCAANALCSLQCKPPAAEWQISLPLILKKGKSISQL